VFDRTDEQSDIRWLPVKNTAGTDAPSYGVMKVTGRDATTGVITVTRPDADSLNPSLLLVNGPGIIPASKFGMGSRDFPLLASVATGGLVGGGAGTAASSWQLALGKSGFTLVTDEASGLAMVVGGAAGGTANVKKVLITSWQCKDDPSKTTCNGTGPSPHCYYPGKLQTLTCAGWTDGANVWVVFTLENLLTPVPSIGGGAPPTLVVIGTRVDAADEGFSYAPDNMGSPAVHPNNGESRPVWSSDFYAALVGIGCGPPLGGPLGGES
jgi:hypothetical protein